MVVGEVASECALATEDGDQSVLAEEDRLISHVAAQSVERLGRGDDADRVDTDLTPEGLDFVFVLFEVVFVEFLVLALLGDIVGVDGVLGGSEQFSFGDRHSSCIDLRGGDHLVDGVENGVPVLDDRSADLVPQLQAFAAFEGAGAGGKCAEYRMAAEEADDRVEFAHLTDVASHVQGVFEFRDHQCLRVTCGQFRHADEVEREVLFRFQTRLPTVRRRRPTPDARPGRCRSPFG